MTRQMKLGMFVRPGGHHIGAWRLPEAPRDPGNNLAHNLEFAQLAERGLFRTAYEGPSLSKSLGLPRPKDGSVRRPEKAWRSTPERPVVAAPAAHRRHPASFRNSRGETRRGNQRRATTS